ncbi:MAG TPA: RNA methyltransferase, partial [Aliidongia sp.]|nr:RNA methyltransferase [Aliidongia sp.]
VLKVLVTSARHRMVSLLVVDKRADGLRPLLAGLPDDIPLYRASQAVFDRIAGFPMHRGILAIGRREPVPAADALLAGLGPRALVVLLFGIANHDNIGGIFRNAAAFGADAVILDGQCCDPHYRKAIRVSVGASLIVPFARLGAGEDALTLLDRHGFEAVSLSPAGVAPLASLARPPRVAALFGTEGPGLPPDLLQRSRTVAIPMAGGFDSLNVATTSGIVLHHLACVAVD